MLPAMNAKQRADQMVDEIKAALAEVEDPEQMSILITGFAYRDFYAFEDASRISVKDTVRDHQRHTWLSIDRGPYVEVVKTWTADADLDGARWKLQPAVSSPLSPAKG